MVSCFLCFALFISCLCQTFGALPQTKHTPKIHRAPVNIDSNVEAELAALSTEIQDLEADLQREQKERTLQKLWEAVTGKTDHIASALKKWSGLDADGGSVACPIADGKCGQIERKVGQYQNGVKKGELAVKVNSAMPTGYGSDIDLSTEHPGLPEATARYARYVYGKSFHAGETGDIELTQIGTPQSPFDNYVQGKDFHTVSNEAFDSSYGDHDFTAGWAKVNPDDAAFANAEVQAVIAFRGTTSNRDWLSNFGELNRESGIASVSSIIGDYFEPDKEESYIFNAIKFAAYALAAMSKHKIKPENVLVTGHSLGGALAQNVCVYFGLPCLVFSAPGPSEEVKRLSPQTRANSGFDEYSETYDRRNDIVGQHSRNYYVGYDPVPHVVPQLPGARMYQLTGSGLAPLVPKIPFPNINEHYMNNFVSCPGETKQAACMTRAENFCCDAPKFTTNGKALTHEAEATGQKFNKIDDEMKGYLAAGAVALTATAPWAALYSGLAGLTVITGAAWWDGGIFNNKNTVNLQDAGLKELSPLLPT